MKGEIAFEGPVKGGWGCGARKESEEVWHLNDMAWGPSVETGSGVPDSRGGFAASRWVLAVLTVA